MYYKEQLSLRFRNDLYTLRESIICELEYRGKKCLLMSLYRSPSQSSEEFSSFIQNFETTMKLIEVKNSHKFMLYLETLLKDALIGGLLILIISGELK